MPRFEAADGSAAEINDKLGDAVSYAAAAEDVWLLAQFPEGYTGFAVEVGAYDGASTSNTLLLEHAGWTVLCIEPNVNLEATLRANRKLYWIGAASDYCGTGVFYLHDPGPGSFSSLSPALDHHFYRPGSTDLNDEQHWKKFSVQVRTLDSLLRQFDFPHLDVLSIDTEGTELDVLKGTDLDLWKPKCLVVESWDEQNEVTRYLSARGYRRVARHGVNDLFIRNDDA